MSIGSDGSLSVGSSIATGGVGGNYVNGTTGAPHFPDALSSADAVVTAGNVSSPNLNTIDFVQLTQIV